MFRFVFSFLRSFLCHVLIQNEDPLLFFLILIFALHSRKASFSLPFAICFKPFELVPFLLLDSFCTIFHT